MQIKETEVNQIRSSRNRRKGEKMENKDKSKKNDVYIEAKKAME